MYIKNITLKNFRCFASKKLEFDKRFILIKGNNGSGKTSILEALHYACYLRSFRTHLQRELVRLGDEKHFFLNVGFHERVSGADHSIQIGTSTKEKIVKFDNKPIKTYKELLHHYRVVTLSEDDLSLVQGSPEVRRSFLNQALMLQHDEYINQLRACKQVVSQRNSLLLRIHEPLTPTQRDELKTWSHSVWQHSRKLAHIRTLYLEKLESIINEKLLPQFKKSDRDLIVTIRYQAKHMAGYESFEEFWASFEPKHMSREVAWSRTLFGAHLDDFVIEFAKVRARVFASRGEQKLIVFLIKLAQLQAIEQAEQSVLLLDDFLTDFDENRFSQSLSLLVGLPKEYQIFITSPLNQQSAQVYNSIGQDIQTICL